MKTTVPTMRQNRNWRWVLVCATSVFGFLENEIKAATQQGTPTPESVHAVPQAISDNLGRLLTLTAKGDRLEPKICTSYEEAIQIFETMGARSSGGSSSGGGDAQWNCNREGDKWKIAGLYGMETRGISRPDDDPKLEIEFTDKTDSGWRLNATASNDGRVWLLATKKDSAETFRLNQQPDGSLFVVAVTPSGIVAGADANFSQLLKSQPQVANEILLSELRKWGLSNVSGRFSAEVRDLLLRQFASPDENARKDFDKAVSELSAAVFETREQASVWLTEHAKSQLGLILASLLNSELPPEPRARLRKIVEKTVGQSEFETIAQIEKQKLADDPEVLIWLVGEPTDDNTRSNIYVRLQKVTGEALGNDPQAWRDWLVQSGKQTSFANNPVAAPAAPESYSTLQGTLLDVAPVAAVLLPLEGSAGKIKLDRHRWSQRYEGKSVLQLSQELRQYLSDRHLPLNWINVDDELLEGIDYPHLIFPQLELRLNPVVDEETKNFQRMVRFRELQYRETSNNLHLQTNQLRATLETDDRSRVMRRMRDGGDKTPKPIYVLTLVDEKAPENSLWFAAWPNGALRIVVTGPATFVQIFQSADGKCLLDCAVERKTLHREFADADALRADPHFQEKVADYLKQYGVQIDAAADQSSERP